MIYFTSIRLKLLNVRLFLYPLFLFLFVNCGDLSSLSTLSQNTCKEGQIIRCVLSNGMTIDVLLPPNYDDAENYPVMLFNDGETVFNSSGLNANFIIDNLISSNSIKPIISVAIFAKGNRNNIYIPYNDEWIARNWGPYKSQSQTYFNQIIDNLLPFLETKFSIDTTEVGILGVSLGGLVSTWMGLKHPEKIKYSASLSGSFWVGDYRIFEEVKEVGYNEENKFWFDIGATTGEWNYYAPLYSALDSAGVEPGKQSFYYEDKGASHSMRDWSNRLHFPLKIFFSPTQLENKDMNVILECIQSSANPDLKFKRMNPIITLNNDAEYSLAHAATYTLLSGEGQLGSEGSFENESGEGLRVLVEYEEFTKEVTIPTNYCQ